MPEIEAEMDKLLAGIVTCPMSDEDATVFLQALRGHSRLSGWQRAYRLAAFQLDKAQPRSSDPPAQPLGRPPAQFGRLPPPP